ncbi:Alpha/beta hydrolase family-domain-containing protein [Mycena metata]|uniref:Alpha/beta hydrolase family-domain-containing protein n=1 Tax=Mycena metata TaxID=1033252 RepID=A0AAD7JZF6_9AGAR|nr:Alpha/beta hydrolase family-domain-containing protein [Mycena metata]
MSYPLPLNPRPSTGTHHAQLLPIYPPPVSALPNPLPSPIPPRPFPDSRYKVSTHLVPAAHLRTTPLSESSPPSASFTASKEERRTINAARAAWVLEQASRPHGRHERVLWSAVNRYVRTDGPGAGVTLFLAHANGFPKETWEPVILELLAIPNGPVIDEIWAWEATHHGASFQLNAATPLAAANWADDARDVLNFLLHFLPSTIIPDAPLPAHLPRVAPEESALRKVRGFSERSLFATGHSFGGCCCLWAALTHPRLFASLTLVDPVIIRFGAPTAPRNAPSLMHGAVARRDSWPSREAAHTALASNPFFASWDPRVLDAYVNSGLVDVPGGGVRLAMPPLQEGLAFQGTASGAPVWDMLPTLEERIPLRWVLPGKAGESEIGEAGSTQERVWRRPANSSNVRIPTAGHLIVQQAPREMAREIAGMLEGRHAPAATVAKL